MEELISDVVTGSLAGALALLGLILAAHAHDAGMSVFGLSLVLFGVLFVFGRIAAHYDRQEAKASDHG
ncbi:MAG: hypothetical protein ACOVVK_03670 [Elsteraceae bacterium]